MKIFALKEESSDNSETVVYGWLTYFEEEKEFRNRLLGVSHFFLSFCEKRGICIERSLEQSLGATEDSSLGTAELTDDFAEKSDGSLRCVCVIGADTGVLWTGWLLFGDTELEKTN